MKFTFDLEDESMEIESSNYGNKSFTKDEAIKLRDLLNHLYPETKPQPSEEK